MKKILLGVLAVGLVAVDARAASYEIDPAHTNVGFSVRHLTISRVHGRFGDVSGTISYDPANVAASNAEAKIAASSISTENKKRDDHLRNPDFLEVEKHPQISFKSAKIEPVSDKAFKAHGDLTIRGVTKPVVLDVTYEGSIKDPQGKDRAAFSAKTTINRKEFGVAWNKLMESGKMVVGEEVDITLDVEAVKVG